MSRTEVDGQVQLQALPVVAVVEAHVDAALGPGVEQAAPHRVRAHDVDRVARGDAGRRSRAQVAPPSRVR